MTKNKALQYTARSLGRDVYAFHRYFSDSHLEDMLKAKVLDWAMQQDECIPAEITLATVADAWLMIQSGWRP